MRILHLNDPDFERNADGDPMMPFLSNFSKANGYLPIPFSHPPSPDWVSLFVCNTPRSWVLNVFHKGEFAILLFTTSVDLVQAIKDRGFGFLDLAGVQLPLPRATRGVLDSIKITSCLYENDLALVRLFRPKIVS